MSFGTFPYYLLHNKLSIIFRLSLLNLILILYDLWMYGTHFYYRFSDIFWVSKSRLGGKQLALNKCVKYGLWVLLHYSKIDYCHLIWNIYNLLFVKKTVPSFLSQVWTSKQKDLCDNFSWINDTSKELLAKNSHPAEGRDNVVPGL